SFNVFLQAAPCSQPAETQLNSPQFATFSEAEAHCLRCGSLRLAFYLASTAKSRFSERRLQARRRQRRYLVCGYFGLSVPCESGAASVDGFAICRDSRYAIQPKTRTPKI